MSKHFLSQQDFGAWRMTSASSWWSKWLLINQLTNYFGSNQWCCLLTQEAVQDVNGETKDELSPPPGPTVGGRVKVKPLQSFQLISLLSVSGESGHFQSQWSALVPLSQRHPVDKQRNVRGMSSFALRQTNQSRGVKKIHIDSSYPWSLFPSCFILHG